MVGVADVVVVTVIKNKIIVPPEILPGRNALVAKPILREEPLLFRHVAVLGIQALLHFSPLTVVFRPLNAHTGIRRHVLVCALLCMT